MEGPYARGYVHQKNVTTCVLTMEPGSPHPRS